MAGAEQRAVSVLRRKILDGSIAAGERVSEASSSELLGMSRTPVRVALNTLEMEGLLEKREGRGYTVREIKIDDIEQAIRVRGALEGLAAAEMSKKAVEADVERALRRSIAMTEGIVNRPRLTDHDVEVYEDANILFHETIMNECGNQFIGMSFERIKMLPMLTLGTFAFDRDNIERERIRMTVGHSQHVIVLDAILSGDAQRAEAMMREHANATIRYAQLFLGIDQADATPRAI